MGSLRSLLFAAVFALPIAAAPPARAGRVAPAGAQPSPLPQSSDRAPGEYQIKAEFLLNVAKLTEWPASSFERPDSPLTICVVGGNPFGTALDDTLRNQTAGGHPLQSRVIESGTPRQDCHLLFVPRGREASARPLLQSSRRGAVTVGESDRFLDQGGTSGSSPTTAGSTSTSTPGPRKSRA